MANRRDVELVIKAQDQASKVAEQVAAALEKLNKAQQAASQGATASSGMFDKLGAALGELQAKTSALAGFQKVAVSLQQAERAVGRLSGQASETAAEQGRLAAANAKVNATLDELRAKLSASEAALQRQSDTAKKSLLDQQARYKAVIEAEQKLADLRSRSTRTVELDRFQRFEQQRAINALKAEQDRGAAALGSAAPAMAAEITRFKGEIDTYTAAIAVAEREQAKLGKEMAATDAKAAGQAEVLREAEGAMKTLRGEASKLSSALGGVAADQQAIQTTGQQVTAAIETITDALRRQRQAAQEAASIRRTQEAQQPADVQAQTNIARQQIEVDALRKSFRDARDEASRLEAQLRSTASPTAELQAVTAQARARVLEAGVAYRQGADRLRAYQSALEALRTAEARRAAQASQATQNERLAAALSRLTGRTVEAANAQNVLAGSLRRVGDGTRQTLSLAQRLRGEILSVTAATIGLYQAFNQVGRVIDSFRTMEAATSRLGAVFDQDYDRVGRELRFVEETANRLGFSFATMSQEYSKFVIAGNASNFSIDAIRKIFLSTAEAARVLKLPIYDLEGVFLALTQMMSKGKVSSEELRRQLGDRLYGAFVTFAEAIGLSTSALDEALKAGEIFADESTLLKFAAQLDKQYGKQLPDSLKTTTTQLDRLNNLLFQSRLIVAESGFIDALTESVVKLNATLQSDRGQKFFEGLGRALALLPALLTKVIDNIDGVVLAIQVVAAGKIGASLAGMVQRFRDLLTVSSTLGAQWTGLGVSLAGLRAQIVGFSAASVGAARGLLSLSRVMATFAVGARALLGALGGIPGILLTIVSFGAIEYFTGLSSASDKLTAAISRTSKVVDRLKDAFADSKTEAEALAKAQEKVSEAELRTALRQREVALEQVRREFPSIEATRFLDSGRLSRDEYWALRRSLADVEKRFRAGEISSKKFREEVEKIANANPNLDKSVLAPFYENFENVETAEKSVEQMAATLAVATGTANDAQKALFPLAEAVEKSGDAFAGAIKDIKEYEEVLGKIAEMIPGLVSEVEKANLELDDLLKAGLSAAGTDPAARQRVYERVGQARRAVRSESETKILQDTAKAVGTSVEALQYLIGVEGVRQTAYKIPGEKTYTIGIGDTGQAYSGRRPDAGMRISREQAFEDFRRNLEGFSKEIDDLVTVPLTEAMKAALLSLQFNVGAANGLGSAKGRRLILDPLNAGQYEKAALGILDMAPTGAGGRVDLTQRRAEESSLFLSQGRPEAALAAERAKKLGEQIEAQGDFNKGLEEEARRRAFNLSLIGQTEREQKILTAQYEAQTQALRDGVKVSDEQLALIRQQVGEAFDAETAQKQAEVLADLKALSDGRAFEIKIAGLSDREQTILRQIREETLAAQEQGLELGEKRIAQIRSEVGALYDAQNAERLRSEQIQKIEDNIKTLEERRSLILEQIAFQQSQGNYGAEEELKTVLEQVNAELIRGIDNAILFYQSLSGPESADAIRRLELLRGQTLTFRSESIITGQQVADTFAGTMSSALGGYVDKVVEGQNAFKALGATFRDFAVSFLRRISEMIVQAVLLQSALKVVNSLSGFLGFGSAPVASSTPAANFSGLPLGAGFSVGHAGGIVGALGRNRLASPALWTGAARFHSGGIVAGLRPSEVPIIAQRGEEILTTADPRHRWNNGGSGEMYIDARGNNDPAATEAAAYRGASAALSQVRPIVRDMKRRGEI